MHQLIERIRALIAPFRQKGSFAQNFFVTFSGSAAVTVLGFLLTPVMTRIYPPASYGQFAVFSAAIGNLALLSSLTYQNALPLPKDKADALALMQLSGLLAVGAFGITSLALLLFGPWLVGWLQVQALGWWFYLLPIILLFYNLSLLFSSWYTRTKQFRTRAGVDVVTSVTGRAVTIGWGLATGGHPSGLVVGDVFSKFTLFVGLLRSGIHREWGELQSTFSWARVRAVAHTYREFPLYMLPGAYVNTLSAQLPIFFLTSGFGATVVGLYSFSVTLLEIPVSLTGSAIAPVFYQKAAELYHTDMPRLRELTLNIYNKLLYAGILPLGLITIFGDWIFRIAFGARWEMAGVFTGYLGYYYIFKLTSQATGNLYTILGKQRYLLLTNLLLLLTRAAALAVGVYLHDVNLALLLFGAGSLVCIFLIDMHILHLLELPVLRIALRTIAMLVLVLAVLKGLRLGLEHLVPGIATWQFGR
ncbi:oligosaccharide flippase family protein [Hymenobacter sp. H14-R3]|uniref:lipopolysaccharide biosynthesis protein n=1 Tax=Hymenobacter sp. H14-R3 TaxID=3046308 RepID=UPI0024BBC809|nr:oligosaccharide flippase family protein [Hymenobacter sp. H14-R3]MDJ0364556.1 oligosaccharide flippase family protein [Hymenobacter sp. H14-R3]